MRNTYGSQLRPPSRQPDPNPHELHYDKDLYGLARRMWQNERTVDCPRSLCARSEVARGYERDQDWAASPGQFAVRQDAAAGG